MKRKLWVVLILAGMLLGACSAPPELENPEDSPGEEIVFEEDDLADPGEAPEPPPSSGEVISGGRDLTLPRSGLWLMDISPGSGCGGSVPGTPEQRVVVTVSHDGKSMEWVSLDYADAFTPIVERAENTEGGDPQYLGSYTNGEVTENWKIVYFGDDQMMGTLETFDGKCAGSFTFSLVYSGPYEE